MNKFLVVSLVLFVIACALPALEFKNSQGPNDVMLGLRALVVGWSGIFAGVFSWFANPVWLLGVLLFLIRKPVPALFAGIVALAIAAATFSVVGRELPGDEGNVTKTTIVKLLPGCYVWLAGLAMLPIATFFQKAN